MANSMSRIACFKEGCTRPAVGTLEMPHPPEMLSALSVFVCEEHKGEEMVFVRFQEEEQ